MSVRARSLHTPVGNGIKPRVVKTQRKIDVPSPPEVEKEPVDPLLPSTFQEVLKMYFQHIKEVLRETTDELGSPSSATTATTSMSRTLSAASSKRLLFPKPVPTQSSPGPTLSSRFFLKPEEVEEGDGACPDSPTSPAARVIMDKGNMPRSQPPAIMKLPRPKNIRPGFNGGGMDAALLNYSTPTLRSNGKQLWPVRPLRPGGGMGNNKREARWRLDIAHDTLRFLQIRDWPMWQPNRVNIRFEIPYKMVLPAGPVRFKTEIVVSCEDSLSAALRMIKAKPYPSFACTRSEVPLVLNMANKNVRGGGFLHGSRAQEEDLCRLTDLFMALQAAKYPLPEFGANYSFPISILRGSKYSDYNFLRTTACHPAYFPQIAVLSAAAYVNPEITVGWRRRMTRKVEALLQSAVACGHEVVILAAWGCGAFNNPPDIVADIFARVLKQAQFRGRFKQVVFALDTRRSDRHLDSLAKSFLNALRTTMYRPPDMDLDTDASFTDRTLSKDVPLDDDTLRFLVV